ncbi:hypothetical protein AMTR_s00110p00135600 [Amborella trichopoda]|uniref:AIPP2-like SPOC-like domain-containing protein n=2 Tax=Amborella trichopoda TaxID=13333 RepID=W1NWH7_AMBTC|nr:hypothetical protein AMTR_s00110p00135600 [Amborella trichopoda]
MRVQLNSLPKDWVCEECCSKPEPPFKRNTVVKQCPSNSLQKDGDGHDSAKFSSQGRISSSKDATPESYSSKKKGVRLMPDDKKLKTPVKKNLSLNINDIQQPAMINLQKEGTIPPKVSPNLKLTGSSLSKSSKVKFIPLPEVASHPTRMRSTAKVISREKKFGSSIPQSPAVNKGPSILTSPSTLDCQSPLNVDGPRKLLQKGIPCMNSRLPIRPKPDEAPFLLSYKKPLRNHRTVAVKSCPPSQSKRGSIMKKLDPSVSAKSDHQLRTGSKRVTFEPGVANHSRERTGVNCLRTDKTSVSVPVQSTPQLEARRSDVRLKLGLPSNEEINRKVDPDPGDEAATQNPVRVEESVLESEYFSGGTVLVPPIKRTSVLKDGGFFPETQFKEAAHGEMVILPSYVPKIPEETSRNFPVRNALWKGSFNISCASFLHICKGIQAHPSKEVASKAYEFSKTLPYHVPFKLVSRDNVWPKSFIETPPTDRDIALYFFPGEFDRTEYVYLLEYIVGQDLAMSYCTNGAELLVFSSKQLPLDCQNLSMHMYLWGLYRPIKVEKTASNHDDTRRSIYSAKGPCSASGSMTEIVEMEIDMERGVELGSIDIVVPKPTIRASGFKSSESGRAHWHNMKAEMPLELDRTPKFSALSFWKQKENMNITHSEQACRFAELVMTQKIQKTLTDEDPDLPPGFSEPIMAKPNKQSVANEAEKNLRWRSPRVSMFSDCPNLLEKRPELPIPVPDFPEKDPPISVSVLQEKTMEDLSQVLNHSPVHKLSEENEGKENGYKNSVRESYQGLSENNCRLDATQLLPLFPEAVEEHTPKVDIRKLDFDLELGIGRKPPKMLEINWEPPDLSLFPNQNGSEESEDIYYQVRREERESADVLNSNRKEREGIHFLGSKNPEGRDERERVAPFRINRREGCKNSSLYFRL